MHEKIKRLKAKLKTPGKPALRLSDVEKYMKTEYPDFKVVSQKEVLLENFKPLLQNDYGGGLNCSLTSISACIYYMTNGAYNVEEIYAYVKKVARFFAYTPRLWGTLSFTIKPIYAIASRHFGVKRHIGTGIIKNVGFNSARITSRINSGIPVMLNMFSDGRHCYHNHTVTVIGYRVYCGAKKQKVFLVLNDNWSRDSRVLDYDKLWLISSVNY